MNRIFLLITSAVLFGLMPVRAADSTNAVKQFMQKVQQAYKSASYLSFHVVYRYANKDKPQQFLDTMSGEVALDKNRMRFTIGNMETVTNDTYTIQVDNDEKLIYVSTPQSVPMNDPVAMLDSALAHFEGIHAGVAHNKGMVTLTLKFPPGQTYKNIMMVVNEKTGYFEKVVYELYTGELVEKDQLMGQGGSGPYQNEGNIEILFSDYRQGRFNDELFNEGRYINRLAKGQYQAAEKYKDYQVFLASSKL